MASKTRFQRFKSQLLHPYSLGVRNEENLAEEARYKFSLGGIALILTLILFLMAGLTYFLATRIGQGKFRNTSMSIENRKLLTKLINEADSLSREVEVYANYYKNLQALFEQKEGTFPGSREADTDSIRIDVNDSVLQYISPVELALRKEFEIGAGSDLLTINKEALPDISKLLLFRPVEGVLTSSFDPSIGHYGIDLVGKKDEPVKSIAEGTVLLATWTADDGYMLAIQHRYNIVSIYKHNRSLVKKTGEKVSGGEIIAIMGNSGEVSTGPHLHFELWQDGKPINPSNYLTF